MCLKVFLGQNIGLSPVIENGVSKMLPNYTTRCLKMMEKNFHFNHFLNILYFFLIYSFLQSVLNIQTKLTLAKAFPLTTFLSGVNVVCRDLSGESGR